MKTTFQLYIFLLLNLIIVPTSVFACDCSLPQKWNRSWQKDFDNTETIFIGEAIEENKMKILELFKGPYEIGDTINMEVNWSCGFYVNKNEIALLYLDGIHQVGCSPSQLIDEMKLIRFIPSPQTSTYEKETFQKLNSLKSDLHLQNYLTWLRTKKQNIEHSKLKKTISQLTTTIDTLSTQSKDDKTIQFILIGLNFLLIVLVVSLRFKK